MRLLCDESVDRRIADRLRVDGQDVLHVADRQPGLPDEAVLEMARVEGAVLVTEDKDFGDLFYRRGLAHDGVILLRISGLPASRKCELVAAAIRRHGTEMVARFSVISRRGLRIRSLRPLREA